MNEYKCPLCDTILTEYQGDGINVKNGITLDCPNWKCPAQSVSGHGKSAKDAYEIVLAKFEHIKK